MQWDAGGWGNVYRPVSPHSTLDLLEYLTCWVSSPWASGIHAVACFGEQATSVLVLAPRMSGHTELADMKMFRSHYNWVLK